jgi:hypothetical protein
MRRLAAVLAATVASVVTLAAPGYAGTGPSHFCFDGGWTDIPVASSPVTLGVETGSTSDGTWVVVCYATSEVGYTGAQVTGGYARIMVHPDGSGFFDCAPDANPYVLYLQCVASFSFAPTTGGLSVTVQATADTNVTGPVTVGPTGLAISPFVTIGPGVSVVPRYPCIYVLGAQVVPGCGNPIV